MKANLLHKGTPVAKMNISFLIRAVDIEAAIIGIWVLGERPTKKRIIQEIRNMLYSGGADGSPDWVSEDHVTEYEEKARKRSQKLFPTFYKTNQS